MWYAVIIILILIACFLVLRLRFRVELSDKRRVMFLGVGRSGVQVDFVDNVSRVKLWGLTIKSSPRHKPEAVAGVEKAVPIKPTPLKKEKHEDRKRRFGLRRPLHIREWLDIGLKSLRAVRLFVADLFHAVIVEEAEAEICAGFESPHLTGEAFGYYHALTGAVPALASRLRFYPDWTGRSFAGSARLSLAIPMYALVYRTGLMIFRLPLMRLMRMVRQQRKGAIYAK